LFWLQKSSINWRSSTNESHILGHLLYVAFFSIELCMYAMHNLHMPAWSAKQLKRELSKNTQWWWSNLGVKRGRTGTTSTSNFGLAACDSLPLLQLKKHLMTSIVKWRSQDSCENANPSRIYKPYFVVLMKLPAIWRKCVILLGQDRKIIEQVSGILFDLKTVERCIIWPFGFHTMRGISCLAENRLASQKALFCIEWASEQANKQASKQASERASKQASKVSK